MDECSRGDRPPTPTMPSRQHDIILDGVWRGPGRVPLSLSAIIISQFPLAQELREIFGSWNFPCLLQFPHDACHAIFFIYMGNAKQ